MFKEIISRPMLVSLVLSIQPGSLLAGTDHADTARSEALAFREVIHRNTLSTRLPLRPGPGTGTNPGAIPAPVPDSPGKTGHLDNNDRCDGAGAAECTGPATNAAAGMVDVLQDYGMFAVIGAGIRLPDEQLESEAGLEDEW